MIGTLWKVRPQKAHENLYNCIIDLVGTGVKVGEREGAQAEKLPAARARGIDRKQTRIDVVDRGKTG